LDKNITMPRLYTLQHFTDAIAQIPPSDAYWLTQDFQALGGFVQHGIVSDFFADYELDRLTEEAMEIATKSKG
jgi:hypothetical protein